MTASSKICCWGPKSKIMLLLHLQENSLVFLFYSDNSLHQIKILVEYLFTFTVVASKKLIFFLNAHCFLSKIGVVRLRELNTYTITWYQNNNFTNLQLLKTSLAILQLNLNINNFAIRCLFLKWTIYFSVDFNNHNIF